MGKIMEIWNTLCGRWKNRMPKFFRWMFGAGMTLSGTAIAVQEALVHYDITPDEWWLVAYKYLIGIGAGMAAASKFAVDGGFKGSEGQSGNTVLDKDDN